MQPGVVELLQLPPQKEQWGQFSFSLIRVEEVKSLISMDMSKFWEPSLKTISLTEQGWWTEFDHYIIDNHNIFIRK